MDINPCNICEDDNNSVVLIDFGFAKHIDGKLHTFYGTKGYIAPELYIKTGSTTACDIFSVGAIFGNLLIPHCNSNTYQQLFKRTEITCSTDKAITEIGKLKDSCCNSALYDAYDLLIQMLNPNEFKRITAITALEAPFLTKQNISNTLRLKNNKENDKIDIPKLNTLNITFTENSAN